MTETAAATSATLFLAHERALEHAAAKVNRLLTQDAGLTPAECFVVCLRAAAKFLAQYDKDEWRDIIKHASELLLQHAAFYKQSEGDSAYGQKPLAAPARRSWLPWRR
jgi:hypothetical protein